MLQILKLFNAKRAQFVTIILILVRWKDMTGRGDKGDEPPRVEEGEEEVEVGRDARGQHSV